MKRQSGILMPISSLPGNEGIGTFGKKCFRFIDDIKAAGFSLWQILPLNPIGYGHSPYQPFSSFAIDELYIDIEELILDGLIDAIYFKGSDNLKVWYEDIRFLKRKYLYNAFTKDCFNNKDKLHFFIKSHPWVKDYAVFMVLKSKNSNKAWNEWEDKDKNWIQSPYELSEEESKQYFFEIWIQAKAYEQWDKIHTYAKKNNIQIMGDIPFYVGYDSADVWSNRKCFLLDKHYNPTYIAGVPPDYFSETGQRWGNPIYDWKYLKNINFSFLKKRILENSKLYDVLRLDHFRAFDTFWKIPAKCQTAIEGKWIEPPGKLFLTTLLKGHKKLNLVAEDLGNLREEVLKLRDKLKLPGMQVMQFSFIDSFEKDEIDFDKENLVLYIGTHDNDTFSSFLNSLKDSDHKKWDTYLISAGFRNGTFTNRITEFMFSRGANLVILGMQDILEIGGEGRINVPGIIDDKNWTWRLQSFDLFESKIDYLKRINKLYKRSYD